MVVSADEQPVPADVITFCRQEGLGEIQSIAPLVGGMISHTRRLITSSGTNLVLKQSLDPPADIYELEAEGLRVLSQPGFPRTPKVFATGSHYLLIEHLDARTQRAHYWEEFGRALAGQHLAQTSSRFGYHQDNYLGRLRQHNGWLEDGHRFFAERRILRYLPEPRVQRTLTEADLHAVAALAARLHELIPHQPACLLHGDLYFANMLVGPLGEPVMVDPAVYYGWPEAELSMVWMCGRVPAEFFGAYNEINPLLPGWEDRFHVLHLREVLSMIAHFGNQYGSLESLREIISRFAR